MTEAARKLLAIDQFDSALDRATAKFLRLDAARTARYLNGEELAQATIELAELYEDRAAVRDALQERTEQP